VDVLDIPRMVHERLLEAAHGALILPVPVAGSLLGLKRSAAYRAVANGSLPSIVLNGRLFVSLAVLERMLLGCMVDAEGETK
jgi:hypothetical protein